MPRNETTPNISRDASGNPICKRCGDGITNTEMHAIWFDERYPDIPIGPLCEECVPYTKMCSHCHKPFSLFEEGSDRKDEVTYCGDGIWLCAPCKSEAKVCSNCNKLADELHTFGKYKKVCTTCIEKETFVCSSCGERHIKSGLGARKSRNTAHRIPQQQPEAREHWRCSGRISHQ